jgi:UDP-glucose 4-epimerase
VEQPVSLVTGACGFIGGHVVEVLADAGHHVRATDLAEAYEQDDLAQGRFPSVLKARGVEFAPSDMRAPGTLVPLLDDVDYVFHVASVFSYSAPRSVLQAVNVEGTRSLVDLLLEPERKERLQRLVLWGAGGVYGLPSAYDLPLTEETPPAPCNEYLKSKWQQEWLVMEAGRKLGLPFATIRPTGVYGPRAVYGGGQLLMEPAKMKVVAAPASFTARIPFVHVRDVARAALHVATDDRAIGEAFNVSDDSLMSTFDFLRTVAGITGARFVRLPPVPVAAVRSALLAAAWAARAVSRRVTHEPPALELDSASYFGHDFVYSNEKLKRFGFDLLYPDARQGIAETIAWYREQGWIGG